MEGVVHEGWLVKSPPEKRLLKAKWRQRWFVLRHSGLLPGQYILEYFTDNSCRKLKGKIDLDHCDQVDVGSTCETKKTTYQFMFDIITPKRTYYLVAETEAEMNKWVDCICTVGGLKLYVDEGSESVFDDCLFTNPLSMISKGLLSSTALLSAIAVNNNYLTPQEPTISNPAVTNLVSTVSSSNPYIPISECYTGKPVMNGDAPRTAQRLSDHLFESPPLLSTTSDQVLHERSLSSEFYDIPRPLNPNDPKFSTVQRGSSSSDKDSVFNGFKTLPPRVNWNTHPADIVVPKNGGMIKKESIGADDAYDVVPPLHSNHRKESVHRDVQMVATELDKCAIDSSQETLVSTSGSSVSSLFKAPPRPPKPSKLRDRHDYENFELLQQSVKTEDSSVYDIPPPAKVVPLNATPGENKLSASTKVPLSSFVGNESIQDDTYDFPKFRSEDNINATVPAPHATGTSQRRRHAYSNAPPGLFNSKELIFNYEYRPTLMTDYVNVDNKQEQPISEDMAVPGAYANIPNTSPSVASGATTEVPPAVNRNLKPNKKVDKRSFSSILTLQPPPLYKMRANKSVFRKDKYMESGTPSPTLLSSLNGTPPIPNRYRHHVEMPGTSEDDHSIGSDSRRGSTNEDQQNRFGFVSISGKKEEIQYLDLDLDSEPSPSPKSPERTSGTVYKKVDFIKTKAFNEMRQNVEESYRNSQ